MPHTEYELHQPELLSATRRLAGTFIQRRDLYALQLNDGRYVCVREPLDERLLSAHLQGEITLGTYVLDTDSRARFVVLDADGNQPWEALCRAAPRLREEGIPAYLEQSRRGGHLWCFFAHPVSGQATRAFAKGLLVTHDVDDVEVFPKQSRLRGGPGSLIRLPFGIHRCDGRRYGFISPDGSPLAPNIRAQLAMLAHPTAVTAASFEAYRGAISDTAQAEWETPSFQPVKAVFELSDEAIAPLSERVKAAVSVYEFVSLYVKLSDAGVGLCPFHDDHHPSFSVNTKENYWYCFTCKIGGSIIDFFMRYHGCDFKVAVRELARMLL